MGVDCGFWRRSGEFRVVFLLITLFLLFFLLIQFLFGVFLTCFELSVVFCWVLVFRKCKW